jgi:DNA repair exonuclease SbcCD ATPase subunit
MVELEFDIGAKHYLVRRGLKPAVFDIVVDGDDVDKLASAKDFQNNFESNTLKMNYKSFCSVVILGSRYDSFMNMTPADRRKVVEDVLDIEIFSEMNVLLKDKLYHLKDDIKSNNARIGLVEEKKHLQKSNIESSIKERQTEIEDKQARIEHYQKESDEDLHILVEEKRDAGRLYTQIEDKKAPLESKKKQADEIFRDLTKTKNKNTKELKFFTDTTACPTCEQHIEDDFRTRMIGTKGGKVDELQTAINSLTTKIVEIDKGIGEVQSIEHEYA